MTGRTLETLYPKAAFNPGAVRLRLDQVSGQHVQDVSMEVHAGEVVGVAGLVGSGKSELGRLCFDLEPFSRHDRARRKPIWPRPRPHGALARGLVYYPADRRGEGLVLPRPVRENLTFAALDQPGFSTRGFLHRGTSAARPRRSSSGCASSRRARASSRLPLGREPAEGRARQGADARRRRPRLRRATAGSTSARASRSTSSSGSCARAVARSCSSRRICRRSSTCPPCVRDPPGRVRAELTGDQITEERVLANFFDTRDDVEQETERGTEA